MTDEELDAIEAIRRLYEAPSPRLTGSLIRYDLLGRPYVHLDPVMRAGMERQGYDADDFIERHEASLRAAGKWPADRLPDGMIEGEIVSGSD